MTVGDRLDRFRARFPGCFVVAFADLSTGMVLADSSGAKTVQEQLDALCHSATDSLNGNIAQQLPGAGLATNSMPQHAVALSGGEMACFLRSPTVENEALCILCDPQMPLSAVISEGAELLADIGREA